MSLVACECPPGPGLEPEPCSRARSQARVYLEQIRNRVAPGAPDMTKHDYLVDAATQIHLALERDVSEDYEAAFNHYQNGVDVLLRGMHGKGWTGQGHGPLGTGRLKACPTFYPCVLGKQGSMLALQGFCEGQ